MTTIRAARTEDAEALAALEAVCFPAGLYGVCLRRRDFLNYGRAKSYRLLVDNALGGYVAIWLRPGRRTARLVSIAVHPDRQGRGLATALMDSAENEARLMGAWRMSLEVREDNLRALQLYRIRGYGDEGRLPHYYEDGMAAVRLTRVLRPVFP
ncbi:MAG: GNAT family N-acetyltransferase [Alphaproteobacteria bacterium]|nr:GNAT family N-acetyltransferase [Alphaproteobacteria bacterium]